MTEETPDRQERDGLVAAVTRLSQQLASAREEVTANTGLVTAAETEAAAQRERAKRFRTERDAALEESRELAAQLSELEATWTPPTVETPQDPATPADPKSVETPQPAVRLEASDSALLVAAGGGPVEANTPARTITGRLVPFGQPGATNMGRFTFGPGSIRLPQDPSHVKLLVEHNQADSVGYATRLWEEEDGLWGTFHVPPGDLAGDVALTRAAAKIRDAFSVGVDLDPNVLELARRQRDPNRPTAASGELRENSLVSVPAFTGARVTDVAASADQLVVAAWHSADPNERTATMLCQLCTTQHATGTPCPQATASAPATTTTPAAPAPVDQAQLQAAIMGLLGVPAGQAAATAPETPATVPAAAGQATASTHVTAEPPTYTFDGQGPGFIRDAWAASQDRNVEASARLARFQAEMVHGGPVVERIMEAAYPELATFAVETRATEPNLMSPNAMRAEQLVRALDVTRPMLRGLRTIRLTDATPFKIPTEGEFSAVGAHTEGTAHVAEGDLSLGSVTIAPQAMSGAYRFSRELADASNPAIDSIAVRAMTRDYARKSEGVIATALALQSDGVTAATRVLSVDTPAELRAEIIAYAIANGTVPPDAAFMGSGFFTTHATAVAGDGRPYFPPLNPTNAAGTANLKTLSINVDGVQGVLASTTVAAEAYLVRAEDVLVGESPVLTFRFEQPEGPGIIKVALWGYVVARVLRNSGVRRLTTAAS